MNVEIGTEAAQFPEKEYINGIFLAVRGSRGRLGELEWSELSLVRQGSPHGPGKAAQIDGIDLDVCVCGVESHDV